MRPSHAALLLLLAAAPAFGDALPDAINFQGKLVDPATNNPKNGPTTMTFSIYPAAGGSPATPLYAETQANVPVTNGVFAVEIGTSAALPRDLFLGASAYLGVTIAGDTEMKPLQRLVMSPYAFTARQLSDANDVRLVADLTYATFTSAGNLIVPHGVFASSGTFASGITASSGTFTSAGGYSILASSGIQINGGTLDVNGSGGIDASATGILAATVAWTAIAQPALSPAGRGELYFDSTSKRLKISQDGGAWEVLSDTRTETMWVPTVTHPQATGTSTIGGVANQARCVRFYMVEDFLVERMAFEVTTAGAGTTSDVGFYDDATKALIVHTGSVSTAAVGAKTVTGLNGFLKKGTMYRYCFCSSGTTASARSTNATNVTNTLENIFTASPVEGTQNAACAAGVLPATLGVLTSASVVPILSVIANSAGP